ncbi:MAG: AAA family ATPase [Chlorobi bacterium]|nr:AAA family ATPase [Chlorobiota bacterium]
MYPDTFANIIFNNFPYPPTENQKRLIHELAAFLEVNDNSIYVVKGYAGTGKTTIVSALVKSLSAIHKKSLLLAPTGRAAKVLASYSGKPAFTIHKKIYRLMMQGDGSTNMVLAENKMTNTVVIVDEASMIPGNTSSPDMSMFSVRNLLEDLMDYVNRGKSCRLVLIGDSAQLPPVGLDVSPALDIEYLKRIFHFPIKSYELKEVVRQSLESGILYNATELRKNILLKGSKLLIRDSGFRDVIRINGEELEDALNDAFSSSERENTVVITRSNKRANIFNREIRNRILYMENEISSGDLMMTVKNNYFWLEKESSLGFIANGDIIELMRINKMEEMYGFRFADVSIRFPDYPGEKDLEVKILLDVLTEDGPSLPYKDYRRLFEEVMQDYEEIPLKRKRIEMVKNNPYFNALQVKFSYALTCHKTQGGQWENVFIDQGYLTEERVNTEFFRWLYTAFTRATKKLYLINFHEWFFGK